MYYKTIIYNGITDSYTPGWYKFDNNRITVSQSLFLGINKQFKVNIDQNTHFSPKQHHSRIFRSHSIKQKQ